MGIEGMLKEKLNAKAILLDTSLLSRQDGDFPLTERLYPGLSGLDFVSMEYIEEINGGIEYFTNLMRSHNAYVISQVKTEIEARARILNAQVTFISRKLNKKRNIEDYEHLRELLDNLFSHNKALYKLIKEMNKVDIRTQFSDREKKFYESYLRIAQSYFERRSSSDSKRARLKRPLFLGEELQTDSHLVSTAFTLAHRTDVDIVTRDKGIGDRIEHTYQLLVNGTSKERFNFEDIPASLVSYTIIK